MSVINATNNMQFVKSSQLFARIKKRLSSFDAAGLIDEEDFHDHVAYVLSLLGLAVQKEHEAIIKIEDYRGVLPANFKQIHAAFKCRIEGSNAKSINEQRPYIFYTDTEISKEVEYPCVINCRNVKVERDKIVIRTYVNGEDSETSYRDFSLLHIANSSGYCTDDCLNPGKKALHQISIDEKIVSAGFETGSIYIQYYGAAMSEDGLPMIPDNEIIEKALEYYILTMLYEDFYLNSSVKDIGNMLSYVKTEYEKNYMPQALYLVKLPSFQSMVSSIRRQRRRNKFYYSVFDKTIM